MSDVNHRIEIVSSKIAELHRFLATPAGQTSQLTVQRLITMLESCLVKLHAEKSAEIPEKMEELNKLRSELAKLVFEIERTSKPMSDSGMVDKVSEHKITEIVTVVDDTVRHICEDSQKLEDLLSITSVGNGNGAFTKH